MASHHPKKSAHKTNVYLIAEQERCKRWWSEAEAEILAKNEVLSGFQICASFEWVMQDKPVWTIFEETKNVSDKVLVTQVKLLGPALERTDSAITTFLTSPQAGYSFVDTALGRVIIAPMPALPKVTSKRNTKHMSMRHSDYRIPLPDGDFDKHEQSIMAQASLISFYRHLSPAGGFISEDAVALHLTKDTFISTMNLASESSGSSSLAEVVFDFQSRIQSALLALGLFKIKKADGKLDYTSQAAIKQFQIDFNHKPDPIRSGALANYFKYATADRSSESPNLAGNDLQVRTDGLLESKTVSALFGYLIELKQILDTLGFPTPSDPIKSPKRFKTLIKAIMEAIEIKEGDPSTYPPPTSSSSLLPPSSPSSPSSSILVLLDSMILTHQQLQSQPKSVSTSSREAFDNLTQFASQYRPKEKKRSRRQSTGPQSNPPRSQKVPIGSSLQIASSSIEIPSSHPSNHQSEGAINRSSAKDDILLSSSPKSPARSVAMSFGLPDSPRRSVTSPKLSIGSLPETAGSMRLAKDFPPLEVPVTEIPLFIVFDREYHESVPQWEEEIEIVNSSVTLTGWRLYADPNLVLDRLRSASVLLKGEAHEIVTGMVVRCKSKEIEARSLWEYYTRMPGPSSQVVHTEQGNFVMESLSEIQIAERRLVRCPDGSLNPHVSTLRIQATLVKLGCQAKDFEYSLTYANLRSQDQVYLKYKLDRTMPVDDALYLLVRNIQVSLVALCYMPPEHLSPWYSNYVVDAMLSFEQDYTKACIDGKKLTWASGHCTFSIYEELLHQTSLFHKALLDLGFPVRCTPFEDPLQFYAYAMAYRENQFLLAEALHTIDPDADSDLPQHTIDTHSKEGTPATSLGSPGRERNKRASSERAPTAQSTPPALAAIQTPKLAPLSPLQARNTQLHQIFEPTSSSPVFYHPTSSSNAVPPIHRTVGMAHLPISASASGMLPPNSGSPLRVDVATSPPNHSYMQALHAQLSPTNNLPAYPAWGHEAPAEGGMLPEIEFGSSLASKYKEALQQHQELQSRYQELEESFLDLSNDAAEANSSLQYFEEQYKESVQNYDNLLREYDAVKRTVADNEDAMQALVQSVATLEAKLQKLQRIAQRSFTTQLLWYFILVLLYILLLPALGVTFLIDQYRARYQGISITEDNSIRTRLQRYAKLQLTKLERVIGDIERKVMKVTGLETKEKRS